MDSTQNKRMVRRSSLVHKTIGSAAAACHKAVPKRRVHNPGSTRKASETVRSGAFAFPT